MADELLPSSTISGTENRFPNKLVIDLDDGDDTDELTALFDMQEMTRENITKVVVESSAEETEDWVDEDMLSFLFACIGELENLQQLHINLGGMRLPVRLLADVLEQSPQLQMLCVDSVSLIDEENAGDQGEDEEANNGGNIGASFRDLSEAVRDETSLTYVCLSDILVVEAQDRNNDEDDDNDNGNEDGFVHVNWNPASQLEPFLVSLAFDCPSMKVMALDGVPASATALQAMASSPYLHQLEFWSVPGVNDHIVNIAKAIEGNKVLQKLELCECQLGPVAAQEMTRMLQNNTILQSVVLEMEWAASVIVGKSIASILKHNQTLTNLHLICRQLEPEQSTPSAMQTAQRHADLICRHGLAANTSLKRFGLEFRQPRSSRMDNSLLKKAFAEPLRQVLLSNNNVVLEAFSLRGGHSVFPVVWDQETDFYLQLNRNGLRRQWLWQQQRQPPAGKEGEEMSFSNSHECMVQILLDHKEEDLSTLFYLLSAHPHLLLGL